jgi:pimeloyl-[acyl-carrier protein] synthase
VLNESPPGAPARPGVDDLFPPAVRADPYPFYRELRERAPVHDTGQDLWLVTSYRHCHALLRDGRCSKELHTMANYERNMQMAGRTQPIRELLEQLMSFSDPPDHTRLRGLVQRAFGPRMVEGLRGRVQQVADELLDEVADGEFELISDFAWQFPLVVVAEMIGVPLEDRQRFHDWSRDIAPSFELVLPPEAADAAERATQEFTAYFHRLVEERAREPRGDLLTALVEAEEQGTRLSARELVVNLILIVGAGHETVMNLIGNGMLTLLRNPDQLERLRREPEIMDDAVEELLRYESPVQMTTRFPSEDIEIADQTIPAGTRVSVILAAGNRDPERFPDPDRLDLTRGDHHHLAFGGGIHYCLGNALARIEAATAFRTLIERFPRLELATDTPEFRDTVLLRGLKALPLRV